MEMENTALLQMMHTQTSILEEIRSLRARDDMRSMAPSELQSIAEYGQSIAPHSQQFNMFQPEQYYDTNPMDMYQNSFNPVNATYISNSAQPINPTQYGNVPNVQQAMNMNIATIPKGITDATASTIDDVIQFDSSRMSKQQQADYIAERSQGIQMGAVNAVSSGGQLIGGAAALMTGGLLPSLAVGALVAGGMAYVGNSMVTGAKDSIMYQDILRRDGYKAFNAFESTSEFGGIGFSLNDQQELASFFSDLAIDEFLEDEEVAQILQGSLDNKLLKSVTDMNSFKEKFKQLVDGVKEISVVLDQTLEEAVNFMGELERRGVATERMTQVSTYLKVGSSMLGMDATEFANMAMQQSDIIVQGTTMEASGILEGISSNAFLVDAISEVSKRQDGRLDQYIKNSGGQAEVAGQVEALLRGSIQGNSEVQQQLLSLISPAVQKDDQGVFRLDAAKLNEILNSGKDLRTLQNESAAYTNSLSATDLATLTGSIGSIVNSDTDQYQMMSIMDLVQRIYQESFGMDPVTALTQMGITDDYNMAQLLDQMLTTGTHEDVRRQIGSKAIKEIMDTGNIVDSPGLGKRMKFGIKRLFSEPFEDIGEDLSNSIGDISQETQMWLKGIEETGIVGGDLASDFTEEGLREFYYGEDSFVNENIRKMQQLESYKQTHRAENAFNQVTGVMEHSIFGKEGVEEPYENRFHEVITQDQLKMMIDAAKNGELSASYLQSLREKIESDELHPITARQYEYVLNTATGEYTENGLKGRAKQAFDYALARIDYSDVINSGKTTGDGVQIQSLELIEREESYLKKEGSSLNKELNKALTYVDNVDDIDALQSAVRSGDMEAVRAMTTNKDILGVAEKYSDYMSRVQNLSEAKDGYFAIQGNAIALGKSTKGVYDFIKGSGIFTDVEFDSYFEEARKNAGKKLDADKVEDMSYQELADTSMLVLEENRDIFRRLSTTKQQQLAEVLVTQGQGYYDMSEFYKEGTETIDVDKLFDALLDEGRYYQSGENTAETVLEEGDIATSLDKHKKKLEDVMDTFIEEIDMMDRKIISMQNVNRSYTTTTTPR